jgi:hypothetical protein
MPHILIGVSSCKSKERFVRLGHLLTCSLGNGRHENYSDFSRLQRSVSF